MTEPNRPKPAPKKSPARKQAPPPPKRRNSSNHDDDKKVPNWVTSFLVVVITLVWVGTFIAGLLKPEYQPPEQVNLLFSSMVGGLLLNAASKRSRGGDETDE